MLTLVDEQGRLRNKVTSFSGTDRKLRGLPDDTWARATTELAEHHLVKVSRVTNGGELN
jgi:hypothetical protein